MLKEIKEKMLYNDRGGENGKSTGEWNCGRYCLLGSSRREPDHDKRIAQRKGGWLRYAELNKSGVRAFALGE